MAYVGDLTLLHDATGLVIGPDEPRPDLTIVVANDDGGAIFSTLEQGGTGVRRIVRARVRDSAWGLGTRSLRCNLRVIRTGR
ncbi:MAG: hypothetical protein WKF73_14750 [Nocardioidaceae bacterium]